MSPHNHRLNLLMVQLLLVFAAPINFLTEFRRIIYAEFFSRDVARRPNVVAAVPVVKSRLKNRGQTTWQCGQWQNAIFGHMKMWKKYIFENQKLKEKTCYPNTVALWTHSSWRRSRFFACKSHGWPSINTNNVGKRKKRRITKSLLHGWRFSTGSERAAADTFPWPPHPRRPSEGDTPPPTKGKNNTHAHALARIHTTRVNVFRVLFISLSFFYLFSDITQTHYTFDTIRYRCYCCCYCEYVCLRVFFVLDVPFCHHPPENFWTCSRFVHVPHERRQPSRLNPFAAIVRPFRVAAS